jgi:antitoxin component YwqK of YwqJK toxin-antitoxin module
MTRQGTAQISLTAIALLFVLCGSMPNRAMGQGFTRYTYHDEDKKHLKEIYQVKDTIRNILHGRYISYYLNGTTESKGEFENNETSGVWEFYYETGQMRMRGVLRQNSNYGMWEYFYENGKRSMEGTINGRNREGEWKIYYESGDLKEVGSYTANKRTGPWKTFFEDGTLRGEIEYADDHGRYTEYFHSGKVLAEGPKSGARNVGHWRYFAEDGTLESEGEYVSGKRSGDWRFQFPSGKTSATGRYEDDQPVGKWTYYFEDGSTSTSGDFVGGKKDGYWSTFNRDGSLKSEVTFDKGSGEYREYYPDKKLRIKGQVIDGQNQGKWTYYSREGKVEGECNFVNGKGTYFGYYPSGTLQTKGLIENDRRVGTWELYEQDGRLSGYYKPVYEEQALANEITSLINKAKESPPPPPAKTTKKGFNYFIPRFPEYRGVIMEGNPFFSFVGVMPFAIEFYNQDRLGHQFAFDGIRDPFYTSDSDVMQNVIYKRGYAISLRQKFYNPFRSGLWYFAHELRFTNLGHFSNIEFRTSGNMITVSASEQRAEYGILGGLRLMQNRKADGLTIDSFIGYGFGYRGFDVDPLVEGVFKNVDQDAFCHSFRFGLNIGYCASFNRR